jgi:hypothetical protein
MEVCVVTVAVKACLLIVAAITWAGCFDVDSNGPMPLLMDDFDQSDLLPADRHFDQWRCGGYDQDNPKRDDRCDHDGDVYRSFPYSLKMEATIIETGTHGSAGANLYTQAMVPEDLSRMKEIVFSVRDSEGEFVLPDSAKLYVELYCSLMQSMYRQTVPQTWRSGNWQTFALDLSEFNLASWKFAERTACLSEVDSIHFSVTGGLARGAEAQFVLNVDDVYLR